MRIFRICDKDGDGYLNDSELAELQSSVFDAELQKKHITALKEVLINECSGEYDEYEAQKGVNYAAFLNFNRILIQKMKLHICWDLLRHFGYDDQLEIKQKYINDGSFSEQQLQECRAELQKPAIDFLKKLFDGFNFNDILDQNALDKIFFTNSAGVPWEAVAGETIFENGINYDNWIALWQKLFLRDTLAAFKILLELGYLNTLKNTVSLKKHTVADLIRPSKREVFSCYVIGSQKCGKTSFLDGFLEKEHNQNYIPTVKRRSVVKSMQYIKPGQKEKEQRYMIITEIPESETLSVLESA